MPEQVKCWVTKFLMWMEKKNFIGVRPFTLYFTLWTTYLSFEWAKNYALTTQLKSGADVAMVIAAVIAPISALQTAVFHIYDRSRPPQ